MAKYSKEIVLIEGNDTVFLSLHEVTYSFGVSLETIIEMMDEGIITAIKNEQQQLLFDTKALRNIRRVLKLNRDLGINLAGAALALELLEEIEYLRTRVTKN